MPVDPDLLELISDANAARRRRGGASQAPENSAEAELQRRFRADRWLAVYGSLGPGKINHHVVAPAGGEWTAALVTGTFSENGWGATHGFPGLRWSPDGSEVRVSLLESDQLPAHWTDLDHFEGDDYLRILVPVTGEDAKLIAVSNLYELR